MFQHPEGKLIFIRSFFQVVLYLQRRHAWFSSQPDQSLIGSSVYGRFGSALALLGDLDMDGYHGKQLLIKIADRASEKIEQAKCYLRLPVTPAAATAGQSSCISNKAVRLMWLMWLT